jgi:chromosome segregation ATPase
MQNEVLQQVLSELREFKQETISRLDNIEADIVVMKEDIVVVKKDIVEMKEDIVVMKEDIVVVKKDIVEMKEDIAVMKEDIEIIKEDCEITRGATNELVKWAHYTGEVVRQGAEFPLEDLNAG